MYLSHRFTDYRMMHVFGHITYMTFRDYLTLTSDEIADGINAIIKEGGEGEKDKTVWLSQAQMAELFQKDRTVIGRHIGNIFKGVELERETTCANYAHVGNDGNQQYVTALYNLDVIISIGYRVKSKRGTQFRIWANKALKQYLQDYAVNERIASQKFDELSQLV